MMQASTADAKRQAYGRVRLDPAGDVVAGSYTTQRLTYIVGERGVASGGRIRLFTECDTDWAYPQFHDPAAADYMTVQAPQDARVSIMVEQVTSVLLVVHGRALEPGERLVLTYGDRSGGGPGTRAQTFQEAKRYFWVAVDAEGDGTLRHAGRAVLTRHRRWVGGQAGSRGPFNGHCRHAVFPARACRGPVGQPGRGVPGQHRTAGAGRERV